MTRGILPMLGKGRARLIVTPRVTLDPSDKNERREDTGEGRSDTGSWQLRLRYRPIASVVSVVLGSLIIAGITNAAATSSKTPIGHPGLLNAGQPLHCSGVQAMTPSVASQYLETLGYSVTWQVENRDEMTSHLSTTQPRSGYIIEGVLHDRDLLLVVEVGDRATPANVPACD